MTTHTHVLDDAADIRAALADPALAPELPAGAPGPAGASVAWLRATVARFSSGETHRRRRALVEAELARVEPGALRRAVEGKAPARAGKDVRVRVVRALAEALGMPEPRQVADDVVLVAGVYFGGEDPAADEAVGRLVALLGAPPVSCGGEPPHPRNPASRGCPQSPDGLISARPAFEDERRSRDQGGLGAQPPGNGEVGVPPLGEGPGHTPHAEAVANRIGLLVQACATAALVETATGSNKPLARVIRENTPLRGMRRVATRPTRLAGRDIAAGDVVVLDIAAAHRTHPAPLTFGAEPRPCPGRAHALALAEGLLGRRPSTPFARLHHRSAPLLLPNAWDHASAAALAAEGFPAVGTTSLGVAAAAGLPDGAAATAGETLALARRLGRGPFLLSVDAEGGFSDDPEEVAGLARELHAAGAVGINLEDGRPDGTLAPAGLHAAKIAAVKAAVPDLFVNARTDTHWLGVRREETAARLARYEQAGADGVFVPGLTDPDGIAALVAGLLVPLNVLHAPDGPTLAELSALGVRRVSLGSLPYRTALAAAVAVATAVRDGRSVERRLPAPSYAEVQALSAPGRRGPGDGTR
ncbi:isocitrate lyase/phosphoenolpyruvate mutase family protein [Streptomyces sp. TYQ1024]|uniref:isocitrate lyase/phosphoenolpyruvate mutase family protein n=1 Tax=Streptomyces sp. TYQ1024 TaxID=2762559 RepID=UPI0021AE79DA|nr:isocitrate lyase/phosphoenolpyruvate mutase family protein [Streptomyces sp. TYQ1024]